MAFLIAEVSAEHSWFLPQSSRATLVVMMAASAVSGTAGAALCLALLGLLGGDDKGCDGAGMVAGGALGLAVGGAIGDLALTCLIEALETARTGSVVLVQGQAIGGKAQTYLYLVAAQAVASAVASAFVWTAAELNGRPSGHREVIVRVQPAESAAFLQLLFWALLLPSWFVSEIALGVKWVWLIRLLAGAVAGGITIFLWGTSGAPALPISRDPSETLTASAGARHPSTPSPTSQAFFDAAELLRLTSRRQGQDSSGPEEADPA
jgi:hypothetical protein